MRKKEAEKKTFFSNEIFVFRGQCVFGMLLNRKNLTLELYIIDRIFDIIKVVKFNIPIARQQNFNRKQNVMTF